MRLLYTFCLLLSWVYHTAAQPDIYASPVDFSVCEGTPATLTVGADGDEPLTYQWQYSTNANTFTNLPNTNNATLVLSDLTVATNGRRYRVVVTDANGKSDTSDEAKITIRAKPTITQEPKDITACEGSQAIVTFTAALSGNEKIEWFQVSANKEITKLSSTSSSLVVTNLLKTQTGLQYYANINGENCSSTSKRVTLTVTNQPNVYVNAPPAVCRDQAGYPVDITKSDIVEGSDEGLTYRYFSDAAGKNALPDAKKITTSGRYYLVGSNATCSTTKAIDIEINFIGTMEQPPAQTVCNGGATGITLRSTNSSGVRYVWTVQDPGNVITGDANQTLPTAGPIVQTLTNTGTSNQTITYTITPKATGCADGASVNASVTITTTTAPTFNSIGGQTVCSGAAWSVSLSPTTNQYRWTVTQPTTVSGGNASTSDNAGPIQATFSSTASTNQTVTYLVTAVAASCVGQQRSFTVTVKPQPILQVEQANVAVCSGRTALVSLSEVKGIEGTRYSWTVNAPTTITNVANQATPVASPLVLNMLSSSNQVETVTYAITPSANGCTGSAKTLTVQVNLPVKITQQTTLENTSFCPGDALSLQVTAQSASAITYQWQKDEQAISGATTSSLSLASLTAQDAGSYQLKMTNSCESVFSTNYTIAVTEGIYFAHAKIEASGTSVAVENKINFTYTGPVAQTYLWNFGDNSIPSNFQNPINYYYKAGTYTVTLLAKKNELCFKTFTLSNIQVTGRTAEVFTAIEQEAIQVFPNPFLNELSLQLPKPTRITLHRIDGRLVVDEQVQETTWHTENWQSGIYILTLYTEQAVQPIKLIKR